MKTDGNLQFSSEAMAELVASVTTLSEDYGGAVEEAIRAARERPLDAERARRLYTRIFEILRGLDSDTLSDVDRLAVAEEVRREVEDVVTSVDRPHSSGDDDFFVDHNGLSPRRVLPTPTFNEKPVEMTEGYVDIERLKLWKGNHRLSLHVREFVERNGREPDEEELVQLVQGAIHLSTGGTDPFRLKPLADSIARKGVEIPAIVSSEGEPKDGNRRIAASLLVIYGKGYDTAQKRRARYIRVWRAPKNTTDDQFEAIVVSRNFESDYKEPWPEFIKGRLVVDELELRRSEIKGRITKAAVKKIREEVAKDFAIKPAEVKRYDDMIRWAEDFTAYHLEQGRDPAGVRYKTEKNFQWFYELDAGRGDEKLTRKLDDDDGLKAVVYDVMFDVLDSGTQVRNLYRVVDNAETAQMLLKAHELADTDPEGAENLVDDAITEAKRRSIKRRSIGFESYLAGMVDRLGTTPPDQWKQVDTELLLEVRRVLVSTLGSIEGQATVRREHGEEIGA
ncbi:MAG TPA: hypothetical protein VGX26_02660 [Solirubrobacteraceae bacterium]|jgi:hypothetical protein|nr:hypothetical protein [Solirubrobacteraceae bacterium]